MEKKDPSANSTKLSLGFKCGDCLCFAKTARFEQPCEKLGVLRHANAPVCFVPNPFFMQKIQPDVLNQLGLLFREFNAPMKRVLLGLLRSGKTFEDMGLAFGQPVYFCMGEDYLSNYYTGYVIGVTSVMSPSVYVTTDLNKKQLSRPVIATLMPESVHVRSAFLKKREQLIERKRVMDPNHNKFKRVIKKNALEGYEPPSMDSVPAEWFDDYGQSKVRKSRADSPTNFSFVAGQKE